MSLNCCSGSELRVSFADKENSKVRNFLNSITDSLDFQQTDCFYHQDKGFNIYTDQTLRESGDNCKLGGAFLGGAVICQRSLAEGFGQHKLLTGLAVKARVTSNFRNLTTEAAVQQTVSYNQVENRK